MGAEDLVIVAIPAIILIILIFKYFQDLCNNRNNREEHQQLTQNQVSPNENLIEEIVIDNSVHFKDKDECSICFLTMKSKESSKLRVLTCKHVFHAKCIEEWNKINNTCPICRT